MVLTPFGSIHSWILRRFRVVAGNLTHKIKSSKSRPADFNIPNVFCIQRLKSSAHFKRFQLNGYKVALFVTHSMESLLDLIQLVISPGKLMLFQTDNNTLIKKALYRTSSCHLNLIQALLLRLK